MTKVDETINAAKYVEILNSCLWPVIVRYFPDDNYCCQNDNAPVHRTRVAKPFMDGNEIKIMEWPAQSPELNIIENVWLKIKIELQNISATVDSRDQLYDNIFQIWTNISVDYIKNSYLSIPKRIRKVQAARGYTTSFFYILSLHESRSWF